MTSFSPCPPSVPTPISIPIRKHLPAKLRHQSRLGYNGWDTASGLLTRSIHLSKLICNRRSNNTLVFNQTGDCSGPTTATCIQYHGGGFDKASSSSWSQLSTYTSPESLISIAEDLFGSDTLAFGASQNLDTYPIGIFGTLGHFNDPPNNILGLGSNSTFLSALLALGLIASKTFSIFWGLQGTDRHMDGSLVIGGFDSAKISGSSLSGPIQPSNNKATSVFDNNCGTGLFVTVKDINLNFPNGSTPSILGGNFSSGLSMCIDPAFPGITLPPNTGPIIEDMIGTPLMKSGLDGAGSNGGSFFYSWIYPASNVYEGDLTFHFENDLQIVVTNDQLIVPVWTINENGIAVQTNDSLRKFLINPLGWPVLNSQPILGQPFLSSTYLMVNHDSNKFTIANINITTSNNILALGPSSTCIAQPPTVTSSSTANSGSSGSTIISLAPGAIVGDTIGGVAFTLLVCNGLAVFFKRRKVKRTSFHLSETNRLANLKSKAEATELSGEQPKELSNDAVSYPELPHPSDHLMAHEI